MNTLKFLVLFFFYLTIAIKSRKNKFSSWYSCSSFRDYTSTVGCKWIALQAFIISITSTMSWRTIHQIRLIKIPCVIANPFSLTTCVVWMNLNWQNVNFNLSTFTDSVYKSVNKPSQSSASDSEAIFPGMELPVSGTTQTNLFPFFCFFSKFPLLSHLTFPLKVDSNSHWVGKPEIDEKVF